MPATGRWHLQQGSSSRSYRGRSRQGVVKPYCIRDVSVIRDIHAAPRQGPPAPRLQGVICSSPSSSSSSCCCCCCSRSNILDEKQKTLYLISDIFMPLEEITLFLRCFCSVKGENRPKTSLFTLLFSERVDNTAFCDVFSTRGFNVLQIPRFSSFFTSSSQSKPAKNAGICSVLTRQHAKQHDVLKQFFTIFQLMLLHWKNDHFSSIFATAHPDSRRRWIGWPVLVPPERHALLHLRWGRIFFLLFCGP